MFANIAIEYNFISVFEYRLMDIFLTIQWIQCGKNFSPKTGNNKFKRGVTKI